MTLRALFRFFTNADAIKTCPAYELDGAAGVTLLLTPARPVGACMDALEKGLRCPAPLGSRSTASITRTNAVSATGARRPVRATVPAARMTGTTGWRGGGGRGGGVLLPN